MHYIYKSFTIGQFLFYRRVRTVTRHIGLIINIKARDALRTSDYDQEHTIANLPYARATHLISPLSSLRGLRDRGAMP